jgi:urease accessory protein
MVEHSALLRLLTWLSPAFPTGGFAYSHGLEWAAEAGDIRDEAGLCGWTGDLLRFGSARSDAIILRAAHRAAPCDVTGICDFALAIAGSAERRLESLAQGAAFRAAASAWVVAAPADGQAEPEIWPYPVAVGVLAAAHHVPAHDAVLAYLHGFASAQISAAMRLGLLGQAGGMRVQHDLEDVILQVADETDGLGLDDCGSACLMADIASMRHETQYTRLFRT